MRIRNLLIAAGIALAGVTGIAAMPTAASAQEYRAGYDADTYRPIYRPYEARYERYEHRRFEERRDWEARRYWQERREAERRAEWRYHHRHEPYYRTW